MQEWFVISLPCVLVLTPTPFPNPDPHTLYEPPGCWNNLSNSQYPLRDRVIHSLYQLYVNLTLIIEENKNLITVGDIKKDLGPREMSVQTATTRAEFLAS